MELLVVGPNYFVVGPPDKIRWTTGALFVNSNGHKQWSRSFQLLDRLGRVANVPLAMRPLGIGKNCGEGNPCPSPMPSSSCQTATTQSGAVSSAIWQSGYITDSFGAPNTWGGAEYTVNYSVYVGGTLYNEGSAGPFTYRASGKFFGDYPGKAVEIDIQLLGPYGLSESGYSITAVGSAC
jgi:hypothetical protein